MRKVKWYLRRVRQFFGGGGIAPSRFRTAGLIADADDQHGTIEKSGSTGFAYDLGDAPSVYGGIANALRNYLRRKQWARYSRKSPVFLNFVGRASLLMGDCSQALLNCTDW